MLDHKTEAEQEYNSLAERMEEELVRTKERLQTTVEEYESSNEELQASNEELQSMNEELQSTTEHLETSKEELQSVNEELIVVNQELKEKIDALSRANGDLQNLMAATEIATIFLNRDFASNATHAHRGALSHHAHRCGQTVCPSRT
ncbi:MAG: hypothetical protein R2867_10665 [Caldilineaceae bacterium]